MLSLFELTYMKLCVNNYTKWISTFNLFYPISISLATVNTFTMITEPGHYLFALLEAPKINNIDNIVTSIFFGVLQK